MVGTAGGHAQLLALRPASINRENAEIKGNARFRDISSPEAVNLIRAVPTFECLAPRHGFEPRFTVMRRNSRPSLLNVCFWCTHHLTKGIRCVLKNAGQDRRQE